VTRRSLPPLPVGLEWAPATSRPGRPPDIEAEIAVLVGRVREAAAARIEAYAAGLGRVPVQRSERAWGRLEGEQIGLAKAARLARGERLDEQETGS
jgi:hypothetical protein